MNQVPRVPDCYGILGLHQAATDTDIHWAYYRLVVELQKGTYTMKDISTAYTILSDPSMRKKYDEEYPTIKRAWATYYAGEGDDDDEGKGSMDSINAEDPYEAYGNKTYVDGAEFELQDIEELPCTYIEGYDAGARYKWLLQDGEEMSDEEMSIDTESELSADGMEVRSEVSAEGTEDGSEISDDEELEDEPETLADEIESMNYCWAFASDC